MERENTRDAQWLQIKRPEEKRCKLQEKIEGCAQFTL